MTQLLLELRAVLKHHESISSTPELGWAGGRVEVLFSHNGGLAHDTRIYSFSY